MPTCSMVSCLCISHFPVQIQSFHKKNSLKSIVCTYQPNLRRFNSVPHKQHKRCDSRFQTRATERAKAEDIANDIPLEARVPANGAPVSQTDAPREERDSRGGSDKEPVKKPWKADDLSKLLRRFAKVAAPYWSSEDKVQARLRLGGVFAMTLATTGLSVLYNFLGRDFYNALSSKDVDRFTHQLLSYLAAFAVGIPVYVFRDYLKDLLALRWRAWMTETYMERYFANRTFYNIQSQSLIDNPDQRLVDDLDRFTGTSLSFALALFNATIDLISFSGILYGIYPPLFAVLVIYSLGGTAVSVALGKDLVSLNFQQEKREADFRYGLVRVRENAESIAFYGGEKSETLLLVQRFKASFANYLTLLTTSRNLDFFTSAYRYLIQLLPAAVVAPLYFRGEVEFGVINQSFSAFNHILNDFSLIVYQFQALSSFSAVVDRLGEFGDVLERISASDAASSAPARSPTIDLLDVPSEKGPLLEISELTVYTPGYTNTLIHNLNLNVDPGEHLLVMGPSGSGKTSLLRTVAGLWTAGEGTIKRHVRGGAITGPTEGEAISGSGSFSVFFVPQRPYMVLGTLRQQLLYPTWNQEAAPPGTDDEKQKGYPERASDVATTSASAMLMSASPQPSDSELRQVLENVRLGELLNRVGGLDSNVEWASVLSLGEQQRLAFARLLLSKPSLALLDESTSALDQDNEQHLYKLLAGAGVTFVSVGHRPSLLAFHKRVLRVAGPESDDGRGRGWHVSTAEALRPDPRVTDLDEWSEMTPSQGKA